MWSPIITRKEQREVLAEDPTTCERGISKPENKKVKESKKKKMLPAP